MDKSIVDTVHDSARELHAAGVMKETTLREFDALCLKNKAGQAVCGTRLDIRPVGARHRVDPAN